MNILESYIESMKKGDNVGLANLFNEKGVLHDASLNKIGRDTLHLEGKMAIEMMFHHKFGFNRGPFKITGVVQNSKERIQYFIKYGKEDIAVTAILEGVDEEGKIKRLNIYPI